MDDHTDTSALITGGGQGLGLAVAHRLVDEGCRRIVLAGRNEAKGEKAVSELASRSVNAHFLAVDMADIGAVTGMVDAAAACVGRITALVNSAANTDRGSILNTSPEEWDNIMNVNARGPFFAIQAFARHAIDRAHAGGVVNILSVAAYAGQSFLAPYSASKAALLNITRNSANALAPNRIRVNGINVGWMDTPGEDATQRKFHGRKRGWLEQAEQLAPFGMLVKPQHVARQVSFFLSPASGVVTGSVMDFDQWVVGANSEDEV